MSMNLHRGRTGFVIGGKGGAGATVLCTSLAWALAEEGLQVVLIDLDLHEGQAAMHLCDRPSGPTLQDVLRVGPRLDAVLLDTLLTPCGPRLRMLPAPRESLRHRDDPPASHDDLRRIADLAAQRADLVLLDAPARLLGPQPDPALAAWLHAADHRALVTLPQLSAAFNARRALERLRTCTDGACDIVVNQVDRTARLGMAELRQALGGPSQTPAWRELPRREATVAQAVHQGLAVGQFAPRDPLSQALRRWARDWAHDPAETANPPNAPQHPTHIPPPSATPARSWRELLSWRTGPASRR